MTALAAQRLCAVFAIGFFSQVCGAFCDSLSLPSLARVPIRARFPGNATGRDHDPAPPSGVIAYPRTSFFFFPLLFTSANSAAVQDERGRGERLAQVSVGGGCEVEEHAVFSRNCFGHSVPDLHMRSASRASSKTPPCSLSAKSTSSSACPVMPISFTTLACSMTISAARGTNNVTMETVRFF